MSTGAFLPFSLAYILIMGAYFSASEVHARDFSYPLVAGSCQFHLNDQSGGIIFDIGILDFAGFMRRPSDKGGGLHFSFQCQHPIEENYCAGAWLDSISESDADTRRIMKIKNYVQFHSTYDSFAVSFNSTAVAPPRPRSIMFCIARDNKAVTGRVFVGNERINEAGVALTVLKSMVFD